MLITSLTCIVAAVGAALGGASAPMAPDRPGAGVPIALSVYAHGNHRRPVPGELQLLRWNVQNEGAATLDRVRVDVRLPADWITRQAARCRRLGSLLRCGVGPLAPGQWGSVQMRLTVPRHPRLGPVRIIGRTAVGVGNALVSGPSTVLSVTVVRHR